jgi:hypothetical protein
MDDELTREDRNFSFCSNWASWEVRWTKDSRKDLLHFRDWFRFEVRVGKVDSRARYWDSTLWIVVCKGENFRRKEEYWVR